jgi:TolB-like protein
MRSMAPMSTELGAPGRTVGLADAQHPGVGNAGGTPTNDQIREQLKSIVDAPSFANQNKIRRFLSFIVEQTLAGNERKLKQYSIATEALGRDASFDPELDPIVRLEAGKMRKALEVYYLSEGASDQVRITVPKGGYVPAFSYAEPSFEHGRPTRAGTTLDQSRLLVVPPSLLPGSDLCRMIAHSLFEQLTVELARYNDFSVGLPEGAEATMQFGTSPYALANEYDARFVVTSGAGQTGNKVRMTIRLHDVLTETIIWTESFDFNFGAETLVETQDRTARRVAADIADFHGVICRLLSVEAASRDDGWSAHTAILRHRYIARITNERVYRRARADLEHGIAVAPYNSMLWAALAHTIFTGNVAGFDEDPDWLGLVERYAQHSFELDHGCAYGHVVAATLGIYNRDLDGTLETCRRIMEYNSHAPSTTLSAGFFRSLAGDWDTGAKMLSEALEMISHPPGWAFRATFLNYYRQGEYSRALFEIKRYHATEHFTPSLMKAAALSQLGRKEEARVAVAEVQRICPHFASLSERYFRSITGLDSLADHLKEGLAKAGLAV